MTNHDLDVLRALARLSRMRKTVDDESLALRASGSLNDVRLSLRRLARADLVTRTDQGARLTMMGLAVAVASSRSASRGRATRPTAARRAA